MQFRRHAPVGLVLAALLSAATGLASGPSYSTEPLRDPVRDAAENAVEFAQFDTWLNAHFESTPQAHYRQLKEHLYSIIDSHVKQLTERTGAPYPAGSDPILSECFAWAARMHVVGADRILERLDPAKAKQLAETAALPDSFKLTAEGDYLVLNSTLGSLQAVIPYYFMVGDLTDVETTNGLRTQMAIVSTGFGRHTGEDEASQATIMLVFSPAGTAPDFATYWIEKFGVTPADRMVDKAQTIPIYKHYDPATKLHTEVVFPQSKSGAVVVAYIGLDGTYQWNRQHFTDFLSMLRVNTSN